MNLRHVEERLAALLKVVEGWLPTEDVAEMQSLVTAGEPGVALENLWTQLEEYDVAIPHDVVREIQALASGMGMKTPLWLERARDA